MRIGKRVPGLSGWGHEGRGLELAGSGWRSGTRAGTLEEAMRRISFRETKKLGEPSKALETTDI